jgi:hypothetical protein
VVAIVHAQSIGVAVSAPSVFGRNLQPAGKRSEHPRGMLLNHTHAKVSSEQAWEPMASSGVNFCRKTRTVRWRLHEPIQWLILVPTYVCEHR